MRRCADGRELIAGVLFLVVGSVACQETTSPPSLFPGILDLGMEATGEPNFASLRVRLDREAAVEVEYWTEGTHRLRVASPPGVEHTLLLSRLRAGSTYDFHLRTWGPGDHGGESRSGQFTTGVLPADLAEIRFDAAGAPTSPLILLVVNNTQTGGFTGFVVVDAEGEVVWYLRVEGPTGITRRANGNFAFVSTPGLVEVAPTGATVAEAPSDPEARRFHHDVIATPGNTLLAIATDTQTVGGTRFTGESIWEWAPESGELRKRWSAFDVLDPFADRGPRFSEENWIHANSLWLGTRENVLLSSNYLNQVLSISPDFSSLEWRMGGPNATIVVEEEERFSGQHTAAEMEDGRILLFDNRREQGGYSRAVEFELDGDRARRVWEWRPERDNFASVISSARRQPGGGTLVAFGTSAGLVGSTGPVEVYEVSREGDVLWCLQVSGLFALYRAEPLFDIAGEVVVSAP
jgi:hypothetical protein